MGSWSGWGTWQSWTGKVEDLLKPGTQSGPVMQVRFRQNLDPVATVRICIIFELSEPAEYI